MSKLWGGRFTKKTDPLVEKFTKSIQYDQKLASCDCFGSLIHIEILKEAKLISKLEYKKLESALEQIFDSVTKEKFQVDYSFEDIHSYIQHLVGQKAGKAASKLHTCRSRNDQIVFDMKLFCAWEINKLNDQLLKVSLVLIDLGSKNPDLYIPGYTHLQHAIPVKLSRWLGAYSVMVAHDIKRFQDIRKNMNLTLGSGALAGTMIKAQKYNQALKNFLSKNPQLGFSNLQFKGLSNSIYTVSDRDFILEILNALALVGMHLSRLAEDFILWSTKEFDFIDIDEAFCTGSSLMPQKKNPDVLELIRGYSGRLYGNLISVLVMMKGLPLSYNRDMQLDKEPLFNSLKIVKDELAVLTELLPNIKFKKENIAKQLNDECLYATDLSDHLVINGVAFKAAHTIIGQLIQFKLTSGKEIRAMTEDELKKFHPLLTPAVVKKIIDPKYSVESKKSIKRKRK